MKKYLFILAVVFIGASVLSGCTRPVADPRPIIVTSIEPVADMIRQISGSSYRVVSIIPLGSSPHDFEPKPRDIATVSQAQLVFLIGNGFDDWMKSYVSGADIVTLSTDIADITASSDEAEAGARFNPHIWLSPARGAQMVDAISTVLQSHFPSDASDVQHRAETYRPLVLQEDLNYRQELANLSHRSIIAVHAAWVYLAKDYGLTIATTIEPIPGQEPTPRDRTELGRIVREQDIQTIFTEPQLAPDIIQSIADDFDLRVIQLDPEGSPATPTYLGLLAFNRRAIVQGLR